MMTAHQRHWRVDQWGAFLASQEIPCMPRSKMMLVAFEEAKGDALSARELAQLAGGDPLLCLRLLRAAEARRSQRLGHDTTTTLGAAMQLGVSGFRTLVMASPEADADNDGLAACESRSVLASQLALLWSSARADISPHEIGMATLLADIGELLLWVFAPEIPSAARDALASGRATRNAEAQTTVCGFKFRELSVKCAEIWGLPPLIGQLIRGVDSVRANISRLCIDTARHLTVGPDNPALPDDLAQASRLVPQATLAWLASQLIGLDEERQAAVVEQAREILSRSPMEDGLGS